MIQQLIFFVQKTLTHNRTDLQQKRNQAQSSPNVGYRTILHLHQNEATVTKQSHHLQRHLYSLYTYAKGGSGHQKELQSRKQLTERQSFLLKCLRICQYKLPSSPRMYLQKRLQRRSRTAYLLKYLNENLSTLVKKIMETTSS